VTGDFTKLQFRDMMRAELFRYARRGLSNALKESSFKEFEQGVLMLKMIETNVISHIQGVRDMMLGLADTHTPGGFHNLSGAHGDDKHFLGGVGEEEEGEEEEGETEEGKEEEEGEADEKEAGE